ncbi:hypothetical protein SEA_SCOOBYDOOBYDOO_8 [Mycobacterium phage ScoobyDoobyDoo]|nr:hypothetical protein SEA_SCOOBYDOOBYDOO_8 [Mycobacterium phage ScoobyDoobyDoo]
MKKLIASAAAVALTAASLATTSVVTAPEADAYPGCYYSYRGCYLGPGWYGGRYWGGGPWWGWGPSLTDSVMGGVRGCVVPPETGGCG